MNTVLNKDLTDTCRLCRQDISDVSMKERCSLFDGKGERYIKLIYNTFLVQIKGEPGLPKWICKNCLQKVTKMSTFQVGVRRGEEYLRAALEKKKTVTLDEYHSYVAAIQKHNMKIK